MRLADMSKQDPPSGLLLTSTVTCAKGLGFEDLVGQKDRSIFDVLIRTTCSQMGSVRILALSSGTGMH